MDAAAAVAVACVAHLCGGMAIADAARVLATWGAPFQRVCAGGKGRPAEEEAVAPGSVRDFAAARATVTEPPSSPAGKVALVHVLLGPGPSPFGPLRRGSLTFVEDRLFWVDLDVEGPVATASDDVLPASATAGGFPDRCTRLDPPCGWACVTGDGTRHHVTLAFHRAALAGAIPDDDVRAAEAVYEEEIAEAFGAVP